MNKNIIAVEIYSNKKEKRFELYELLEHNCLFDNNLHCSILDIDQLKKQTIGYISICSNDLIIKKQIIYKKPEFKHLQTTKLKSVISYYGDEPGERETLISKKSINYYALYCLNYKSINYYQQIISKVIDEQLKASAPHYTIKLKSVFLKTDIFIKTDLYLIVAYNTNFNLFTTHNDAMLYVYNSKPTK